MAPEEQDGSARKTRRLPFDRTLVIVIALLAVAAMAWYLFGRKRQSTPPPAPLLVQTMTVVPKVVPDIIEASGTIVSPQTVEVRPQTDGVLESVRIADGAQVRRGQLLFTIDPRPLRAAMGEAQATLARDQALAADAADTASRYAPLAQTGAVDRKSYVTAVDTERSLRGTVASDRAQIAQARLSLAYTQVRAPISGRAGVVQIRAGNVVTANSSTPLVTLNVAAPIEASFALPHVQVDAVRRAGGSGLPVLALDSVSGRPLDRGRLHFLDNAFDDSSGTLTVRARFANRGGTLMPGQFVTVRVILSEHPGTLAVPETALQQGQAGPYVYALVGGKAVLRQLTVARMVDGQAVVTKGIKAGDTVILTVPNELREGSAVQSVNQKARNQPASKTAAR
ncbi:putative membrane-fusion protein [Sphingomonas sp. EC-HK361]|uniref:efflux RND transporter periplasmic adaptor subunit n=1 Tax=Sphingomonas sp. EC-HK361 TaxID=2038397 RepID=UPI0012531F61|nr:efflux RND transporter periplasmic adaptor subunit [Sphingomonas sp. EC-HK361]VVT21944.1 putative membrane-fusion protein [Sphingomonas sp. EC-HK361]